MHILARDDIEIFRGTACECFIELLKRQSGTPYEALKNDGWDIQEAGLKGMMEKDRNFSLSQSIQQILWQLLADTSYAEIRNAKGTVEYQRDVQDAILQTVDRIKPHLNPRKG